METFVGTVVRAGQSVPVRAEIRVGADGVEARTGDGEAHAVRFDAMTLETGGYEGDFVFCRPRGGGLTISTNAKGFVDALRAAAGPALAAELEKVGGQKRRRRAGAWISTGVFLALVAGVGAFLWNVPSMVASTAESLPASIDRQVGDAAFTQMQLEGATVQDPAVQAFLEEIVARLSAHAEGEGWDFRVTVVDREDVNAFALPGGRMVVLTGLLRAADSPDQVAGVMAHEMAHVTRRHGMRNVAHQAGIALGVRLLLGDASGWTELAADLAIMAKANDYSREQEADADAEGARMLMAAGLDPSGLADFFRLLEGERGSELGGALEWLSTHPDHESRIAHVEELSRTLPAAPRRPLEADWEAVKAAVD